MTISEITAVVVAGVNLGVLIGTLSWAGGKLRSAIDHLTSAIQGLSETMAELDKKTDNHEVRLSVIEKINHHGHKYEVHSIDPDDGN